MGAPASIEEFLDLIRKSGVVEEKRLDTYVQQLRTANSLPTEVSKLAGLSVRDGILTHFQAEQFSLGKWRRFTIGKYKVLERLGSGGMGSVYLCEHKFMRRRVAVKVLPAAKAEDPSSLERFYREARAAAALDHPNIVRAYDIDQDDNLHFLVMEYVDGASLQEIVKKTGPMQILRAAHYVRQAAIGLQHAHEAGLVHRDIKPGNLLVDRMGTLKVLDMGLARFFNDEEDILTKKYDESVLGTADYLAPEQALDSHSVDIRADIYSLGATFYFCLTGCPPFNEGTVAQKLIWHQTRQPKPVRTLRAEVPEALAVVLEKMMAKDLAQRFQTPVEVFEALTPWTSKPISAPPENEMPRLSPAALGATNLDGSNTSVSSVSSGMTSPAPQKASGMRLRPPLPSNRPSTPAAVYIPTSPGAPGSSAGNGTFTPAAPPSVPEESPPWERLTADTDDPQGKLDTARSVSSARRKTSTGVVLSAPERRRFLIFSSGIGGLIALLLAIVLVWGGTGGKQLPPTNKAAPPAASRIAVGRDAPVKTIADALRKAKAHDIIVLQDPSHEEQLTDNTTKFPNPLTIEGEPGKTVVWKLPAGLKDAKLLLDLPSAEGLCLRGLTLDGDGRALELISLWGKCPDLKLENLHLRGFTRGGVVVRNCMGESSRPITFENVRFTTSKETETLLLFDINPKMTNVGVNQHFRIKDCRFEGLSKAAVAIEGASRDVEFLRNRFFKLTDGILYNRAKASSAPTIQLTLDSNTFCEIKGAALHFGTLPEFNRIALRNNLFAETNELGKVDVNLTPKSKNVFGPLTGNVRDSNAAFKEGNLRGLATPFALPTPLPKNVNDDKLFLRYPKTSPLATMSEGKPVGVPPAE